MLWRQLRLWPRLVLAVTLGFVVLLAGFGVLALRAVDDSTDRILQGRVAIATMLAEDIDHLLDTAFGELSAYQPQGVDQATQQRLLGVLFKRGKGTFSELRTVDTDARVTHALGIGAGSGVGLSTQARAATLAALASGKPTLSGVFRDSRGRPVVALATPFSRPTGPVVGAVIGEIDTSGPAISQRLRAATQIGKTDHAQLIGPHGIVLASTEPGEELQTGEHSTFYRTMLHRSRPGIETVPTDPHRHGDVMIASEGQHVMAFVRLSGAPWGVAIGGSTDETFAPATRLKRTLFIAGGASLVILWLLTLLGAQLLVRPVRKLTSAAQEMAAGDLEQPIRVVEGGEIGTLGESLETMRERLRDSLGQIRSWGENLESMVAERTDELDAQNRHLAAVGAVLAAASDERNLADVIVRCLDVVLEHTGATAASLRLASAAGALSDDVTARSNEHGFPCPAWGSGSAPCSCAIAACDSARGSTRAAATLVQEIDCKDTGDRLAVVALRGRSGLVGILGLAGRPGGAPTTTGPDLVAAICDQVAATIESARFGEELRQLEADQSSQALRAELISAVSHELRTPLGYIKTYATTLLQEEPQIDQATRREFLTVIDEETSTLARMIEELLDTSRLQAGRLPLEMEAVRIAALTAHVVERARPGIEAEGHRVSLAVPVEDVEVLADPFRIEQVLSNLLANATHYSDPDSSVDVEVRLGDEEVVIAVSNRGEVAQADLERIFEPFHRGENSKRRGIRGAGLGLAICRGIVQAHGGRIWAESDGSAGTVILVALPSHNDPEPSRTCVAGCHRLSVVPFGRDGAGQHAPPDNLVDAIRLVAAGDGLLAPSITRRAIEEFARRPGPVSAGAPQAPAGTHRT